MRVAVVGGKLQGVEACYLARKAGWHVRLIDRRADVLARSLCDDFSMCELGREKDLERAAGAVDLVLPALEDPDVLDVLYRFCRAAGIPLAFDPRAYRLSSSKIESDRLFAELGLSAPKPWPEAAFPLVAKPSAGSGSRGVRIIRDLDEMRATFPEKRSLKGWVLQEYLHGPSYSLEVVAAGGRARCFQVTDLFMDAVYDCKRVVAPTVLADDFIAEFERVGRTIARAVDLRGIMDVEVILNEGQLKLLEIDARLPSQTPTAVFWSSGVNLVEVLGETIRGGVLPVTAVSSVRQAVVYEHIQVSPGQLEIGGEHVMVGSGILQLHTGFFGADEALTDYAPGRDNWRATLIVSGSDRDQAWRRRCEVLAAIRRRFHIGRFFDPDPTDTP